MSARVKELDSLPRKFMFEDRHDEEEARIERERKEKEAAKAQEQAAKVHIKEEELIEARQEGYQQGRRDGYEEGYQRGWLDIQPQVIEAARGHADALSAQALHTIAQRVGMANQMSDAAIENMTKAAIQVGLAVARKLAHQALADTPDEDIALMIQDVLSGVESDKRLILKVHPAIIETIKPKLDGLAAASDFTGTIEVHGDSSLHPYDARLTWKEGGAQRILANIETQVADAIDRLYQTGQTSMDPVEVSGVGAPEGHEDMPMPPAPDFEFHGEPAIPTAPMPEGVPADHVPMPEDMPLPQAPDMAALAQEAEANMDPNAQPELEDDLPPIPAAQHMAPDLMQEEAIEDLDLSNGSQPPSTYEAVGFMKTGKFTVAEFGDEMPAAPKAGFESIDMDSFERLDDE